MILPPFLAADISRIRPKTPGFANPTVIPAPIDLSTVVPRSKSEPPLNASRISAPAEEKAAIIHFYKGNRAILRA